MEIKYRKKDFAVYIFLESHEVEKMCRYIEATAMTQIKKWGIPALSEILMFDKIDGRAYLEFTFENMEFVVNLFKNIIKIHQIEGNLEAAFRFESFLDVINYNQQNAYIN